MQVLSEMDWIDFENESHFKWMAEHGWTAEEIEETRIEFARLKAQK